jgi:hypothetical protein
MAVYIHNTAQVLLDGKPWIEQVSGVMWDFVCTITIFWGVWFSIE